MITFEQIQKANEGLKAIDVKGKRYVMVNEKVKAFRTLFPEGFIHTDIISLENGVVVMQSKAGYYENGVERVLGTGLAFERQDSSFINKTSYIENCETSAIGRALSFIYLGADDSIASAEELANAIKNQNKEKEEKEEKELPPPEGTDNSFTRPADQGSASSSNVDKIPPKQTNPVEKAFNAGMTEFMERYGIADSQEALKKFNSYRESLQDGGVIPKKKKMETAEEVNATFDAIYKNFKPSGEKNDRKVS